MRVCFEAPGQVIARYLKYSGDIGAINGLVK